MEICNCDPVREWDRYEELKRIDAERYPVCAECGESIIEEWCYQFGTDTYICENCMLEHKVVTPELDD